MIIIIGAGLSGLVTAFRLKQAKIPFKILEAKGKIGGRIFTKITDNETPVEMGATWFGRQHQHLIKLLKELELAAFPQFQGQYYHYDDPNSAQHGKYQLPKQDASYRISGGSKSLMERLYSKLDEEDIQFNTRVIAIKKEKEDLVVISDNSEEFRAYQVILAVPPKIWSHQINFSPALPQALQSIAKNTQTWMEDSIKAAIEFETPFWKENGLPSTIMSNYGPFVECYDHSNHQESKFALCGFLSPNFKELNQAERKKLILKQLSNILGDQALLALSYHEYIWSTDDFVKWPKDMILQPHQNNGHPIFRASYYHGQLLISSSESATTFPGYMDGAVEAGERVSKLLLQTINEDKIIK